MSQKTYIAIAIAALLIICGSLMAAFTSRAADNPGSTFTLTMQSPGQDNVVFTGSVLGDDMKLAAKIGGIETVDLLSDGKLYVLTPAIKTAREIDNPDPVPPKDSADWTSWLLEPGRNKPDHFRGQDRSGGRYFGRRCHRRKRRSQGKIDKGVLQQITCPCHPAKAISPTPTLNFRPDGTLAPSDLPSLRLPEILISVRH